MKRAQAPDPMAAAMAAFGLTGTPVAAPPLTAEKLQQKLARGVDVDSVLRMAARAGVSASELCLPGDEYNASEKEARGIVRAATACPASAAGAQQQQQQAEQEAEAGTKKEENSAADAAAIDDDDEEEEERGGEEEEELIPDAADGSWAAMVVRSTAFQRRLRHRAYTSHNRLRAVADSGRRARVAELAAGCRPIVRRATVELMREWLEIKARCGSASERALYGGGGGAPMMTAEQLTDRLLRCRPVAFVGAADRWLLADGSSGGGGVEAVGTDADEGAAAAAGEAGGGGGGSDGDGGGATSVPSGAKLGLHNTLSYDELALSALVGLSCPTAFINAGDRGNLARPAPATAAGAGANDAVAFEAEGVYVGLVGARFERPGRMEWAHMVVSKEQNTAVNGYGGDGGGGGDGEERKQLLRAWARFYGVSHLPTYDEAAAAPPGRFVSVGMGDVLLDTAVYQARIRVAATTLLLEAQARGEEAGKPTYVHAVGLGLGVWQVSNAQMALSLAAYREALEAGPRGDGGAEPWSRVGHVDFSWFGSAEVSAGAFAADGEEVNGVRVRFSRRNPAASLAADPTLAGAEPHLLVAAYAWDGGALPGNEYWWGQLSASGDPAAACCSMIGELGNPAVNPATCGANLRIL
jgi:hypothetical protein